MKAPNAPSRNTTRLKAAQRNRPDINCLNLHLRQKEACVEAIISNLVKSFEKGALTRWDLIRGLAILTAATGNGAGGQQAAGLRGEADDEIRDEASNRHAPIEFSYIVLVCTRA